MLCHKCGKTLAKDDPQIAEEGLTCPYCGAALLKTPPYDPDSVEIPDRQQIDETEKEEDL